VRIWSIIEKQCEAVLEGHTNIVTSVAITSDDKFIVSGSSDHTVRLWNIKEKRQEAVLKDTTWIKSVAIVIVNTLFLGP
jgi:WD40 repeat protein